MVSEMHPESRAVSLGLWVLTGTRDESAAEAGISHFLEHMVFKGTKTRSAFQIAKSLEELGGELNAYTTREYTCYHALVLKDHWRIALDVLSDLVTNMRFSKSDFELEKSVILQELAMAEDSQEELIYDLYFDHAFGGNPLGRPILGNEQSLQGMTMKMIRDRYNAHHSGNNLIVSVAGDLEHSDLVHEVHQHLDKRSKTRGLIHRRKPRHKSIREAIDKPGEQLHLLMGLPVPSFQDKFRFEAFILNALLGGGMTSSLYQKIRERRGLAYTIYSQLNTFIDTGLLTLYAASEPANMKNILKTIRDEMLRLKTRGIRPHEIRLFQTQVKGSLLLGADDLENRMSSIAVNELVFGQYRPVETIIDEIESVTTKSMKLFMEEYFDLDRWGVMLLGAEASEYQDLLDGYRF